MRTGSRYLMIGPTMAANFSLGSQPTGINKVVIKPHARMAPMLGMTMPAMKPPNCCNFSLIFFSPFIFLCLIFRLYQELGGFRQASVFQAAVGTLPGYLRGDRSTQKASDGFDVFRLEQGM